LGGPDRVLLRCGMERRRRPEFAPNWGRIAVRGFDRFRWMCARSRNRR